MPMFVPLSPYVLPEIRNFLGVDRATTASLFVVSENAINFIEFA